jgi:folate-binding protein YgfZ
MPEAARSLGRDALARVRHGAVTVTTSPAIFRIEGTGALTCLQGLLTNDLERPGDHALVYGAILTPKGMIIADYWVLRQPGSLTLVGAREGHAATLELFSRRLPPRLAKVTDLTGQAAAAWLLGAGSGQAVQRAGLRLPEAAHVILVSEAAAEAPIAAPETIPPAGEDAPLLLATAVAPERAPFAALAVGPSPAVAALTASLVRAGVSEGGDGDLDAARILAGWPKLGQEIDDRTLPQEVRYDDIGGVSYTKGCYVGQETVARLHFRGHTNRELRGLHWTGAGPLSGAAVVRDGKEVGTVRSTLVLDDRTLGLGIIRREVETGEEVQAGGRTARVVALPFAAAELGA